MLKLHKKYTKYVSIHNISINYVGRVCPQKNSTSSFYICFLLEILLVQIGSQYNIGTSLNFSPGLHIYPTIEKDFDCRKYFTLYNGNNSIFNNAIFHVIWWQAIFRCNRAHIKNKWSWLIVISKPVNIYRGFDWKRKYFTYRKNCKCIPMGQRLSN